MHHFRLGGGGAFLQISFKSTVGFFGVEDYYLAEGGPKLANNYWKAWSKFLLVGFDCFSGSGGAPIDFVGG
jgi:hypothetical protein